MKLTKIIACLSCCVALCVPSAFAVEETQWVEPVFNFTSALYGSNTFTIFGTETRYVLDDNGMGLYDYSSDVTESVQLASATVRLSSWGNNAECYTTPANGEAPYTHYDSDGSTYYTRYDYSQLSFKSSGTWFYTDLEIEPGFYEFDISFIAEQNLSFNGKSYYFRPVVFEVAITNGDRLTYIAQSQTDAAKFTCEVKQGGTLVFAISTSAQTLAYDTTDPGTTYPQFRYVIRKGHFKYRSIDSVDLVALDTANTNASNTIDDHTQVEQQWTGSMTDNFNALNIGNFTFGDGLISGFGLVSDLFMRIWTGLGSYAVVYTFPLYLGVVLLLIGRISKFSGSQGSSNKRGDGDA